mgnify:CR=1 FL=1
MKTEYNPYVVQMDKFAASLHHLSDTFLKLEEKRGLLTQAETENIFLEIDEKTTLKSWTVMETLIGITGLVLALIISIFA